MHANRVSVIIPVFNGQAVLRECLQSILNSSYSNYEVIVVDDHSDDASVEITKQFPVSTFELEKHRGASYARNYGSQHARGDILIFIDSDVVVQKDTLEKLVKDLNGHDGIDAVMGIYSQRQKNMNFCSLYKNLYVRYKAHVMPKYTSSTSSALLAVRREAFMLSKGFNCDLVTGEDVEFGQRFTKMGSKILVDTDIEVSHNKYYSLYAALRDGLIKVINLTHIAINLRREIRKEKEERGVLSVSLRQLVGVGMSGASLFVIPLGFLCPARTVAALYILMFSIIVYINLDFWKFCGKGKGVLFAIQFFSFAYLEMLLANAGILIAILRNLRGKRIGDFGRRKV